MTAEPIPDSWDIVFLQYVRRYPGTTVRVMYDEIEATVPKESMRHIGLTSWGLPMIRELIETGKVIAEPNPYPLFMDVKLYPLARESVHVVADE